MNENIEQKELNKKANYKISLFLGSVLLAGLTYGVYWYTYESKFEDTENAYVNGNQINIVSSVSGTIIGTYIGDAMKIKKNAQAVKIDNTDYVLALDKSKNELAKAVRLYKSLRYNQDQSYQNVELKKEDLNKAKTDYEREKKSFDAGIISQEEIDNYKYKYEQTIINLNANKVVLDNAKNQYVSKNIMSHPDVAKAIIQYKQSYIDLSKTIIKSPIDGVVAKKAINIGQKIAPNQPLFTIIDEKNEWVDANLKESQLKNIKVGQQVELISDVNDKKYIGYISSIGGGSGSSMSLLPAQNATGNWIKVVQRVPVKIMFNKEDLKNNGYLPLGTSMRVTINTNIVKDIKNNETQEIDVSYNESDLSKQIDEIIKENLGK